MRQFSVITIVGLTALASLMQPAFSQEPIKIGVMFPLTGPVSAQGAPERDAIKQAFEEENNTVAGRKIELLYEEQPGAAGHRSDQDQGTGRARQGRRVAVGNW